MRSNQEQWQLDGNAPELYQRYLVPAMTSMWAADLVDRAALQPGKRAGRGLRHRSGRPGGGRACRRRRTGGRLDLNPGMLLVARSLPAPAGASIEWHEGTALALPFPEEAFDVVLCQLGLQFFPDRPAALQEIRRVLEPNGRVGLNVFGPIEHNPATTRSPPHLTATFSPAHRSSSATSTRSPTPTSCGR